MHIFALLLLLLPLVHANPDFIIVGAGTAGSVLARRLCVALPYHRILVLERAQPRTRNDEFLVRAPRNMWDAWETPSVSQPITSVPNPGLDNGTIPIFTGNTLGGSSSINAAQCMVPTNGTVSTWDISGLTDETALPLYRKAVRTIGCKPQPPNLQQKYAKDYVDAAVRGGYKRSRRPLEGSLERQAVQSRVAVDEKGRRRDAYTAYVKPVIKGRCAHNLQVVQGALVKRLTFSGKKATGVDYEKDGTLRRVVAKKEVIVSAGPYLTPVLLQRSGVGRRSLLEKFGIKMVADLGVGENTIARPVSILGATYSEELEPGNDPNVVESPEETKKFLSGEGGVFGTVTTPTDFRLGNLAYFGYGGILERGDGFGSKLMLAGCMMTSTARGSIQIVSRDDKVPPRVDLNLLGNKLDRTAARACLREAERLFKLFPFKVNVFGRLENEGYERRNTRFSYHFMGACPVGSVLEPKGFKVKGLHNLRVIDASVIKTVPRSAGPMVSVYMLAEFAAGELIKEYGGVVKAQQNFLSR